MDFLHPGPRPKIIRTRLYGDQEFSRFELELLHTPILQRLYGLKQLGFTDKVYPDAVHARFNHILGVVEVVERMANRLVSWLRSNSAAEFEYGEPLPPDPKKWKSLRVTASVLADNLRSSTGVLRLMALLHDITHAAFGHTLEDEVNVFNEKHDDPARQVRFFNALVAQLLYIWCTEERLHTYDATVMEDLVALTLSAETKQEQRWAQELAAYLRDDERKVLAGNLRDLELAFKLLMRIEFAHGKQADESIPEVLLAGVAAEIVDPGVMPRELVLHRDLFMVDLLGNTICADLLDYARRDPDSAGLKVQFDDRFLRYLCVVSVRGKLSPTGWPAVRTAVQIFTDKMRHDVLSEMSGILKARYLLNERVLFHPTKCAAGAMLGTAVQLLGLRDLPPWMQVLGDQEFLRTLAALAASAEALCSRIEAQSSLSKPQPWKDLVFATWVAEPALANMVRQVVEWSLPAARTVERLSEDDLSLLRARARGSRNVISRLASRRFPKLAYRLRTAHHTGGASDETIASTYCRPKDRYLLERKVEDICNLPIGSIVIHCPRRKTSLKVAEVLVVGQDLGRAAQLRNVTSVSPEGLEPYEREIVAIEDMYGSIWQFHAYLDLAYWDKQPLVEWAFERELKFPNDQLLADELAHDPRGTYHLLAGDLREEIPPKWLPEVVRRVDAEVATRARLGDETLDQRARLLAVIRDVLAMASGGGDKQLDLPMGTE